MVREVATHCPCLSPLFSAFVGSPLFETGVVSSCSCRVGLMGGAFAAQQSLEDKLPFWRKSAIFVLDLVLNSRCTSLVDCFGPRALAIQESH